MEKSYHNCPKAIFFDIGMTMIFPCGQVLTQEIHRFLPSASIRPNEALRALSLAAEIHHINIYDGRDQDVEEKIGITFSMLLGLSHQIGVDVWKSVVQKDNLYSILDPDTSCVLKKLKSIGIKTAAISNSSICLETELESFGIINYFDFVIGSNSGYPEKPAPDMFNMALETLAIQAEEAWHVGDGLINDVLGASMAGIKTQILVDPYNIYNIRFCRKIKSIKEILNLI